MFKTILVHLRGTAGDAHTLETAQTVALPFAAHLECLHVRPDFGHLVRDVNLVADDDGGAVTSAVEYLRQRSAKSAQRASDAYSVFSKKYQLPRAEQPPGPGKPNAAFRQTTGDEVEQLIAHSRVQDLLVVKAGGEPEGGLSLGDLGLLITRTGGPILLAPSEVAGSLKTVVIAWKNVREAARAVTAAMPLLEKAETILVATASERDGQISSPNDVVTQLHWHGLNAEAHAVKTGERDAAHAVLEMSRAAKADLLVMGGFGHARLSEIILGGFTQSVLEDASLPVFMQH